MSDELDELLKKLGRDYRQIASPPGLADSIVANATRPGLKAVGIPSWALVAACIVLVGLVLWRVPGLHPGGDRPLSFARLSAPVNPGMPVFPAVNVSLSSIGSMPPVPDNAFSVDSKNTLSPMPGPPG